MVFKGFKSFLHGVLLYYEEKNFEQTLASFNQVFGIILRKNSLFCEKTSEKEGDFNTLFFHP